MASGFVRLLLILTFKRTRNWLKFFIGSIKKKKKFNNLKISINSIQISVELLI